MSTCPGCGLTVETTCEAEFAPVAARFYSEPGLVPARQYVVDAYACQHPGTASRTAVQTTALCLMTLDLVLECGVDVSRGSQLHARMMVTRYEYAALEPPDLTRALTHRHVHDAATAREWAQSVWDVWAPHHAVVRSWNRRALPDLLL